VILSPLIRLDSSGSAAPRWNATSSRSRWVVRAGSANGATAWLDGQVQCTWNDPLKALQWIADSVTGADQTGPAERGRWIGFLSYDLGRYFETIPSFAAASTSRFPDLFAFAFCEDKLEWDDTEWTSRAAAPPPPLSTFSRRAYESAVARVIQYIRAGDVFQVNLSQRFTASPGVSPGAVYLRLLRDSPAAYGALLDFRDFALVSNSPELFLRVIPDPKTGTRRVITRPIKGTRPRSPGMEAELRDSGKDQAELNMIVDLERNDLGRVCEIGSIKVTQPRTIEAHPTVYHGVATVEGTLRPQISFVDLLRATFPGGSVTGAPKIRAMEIIEELEPVRRGPYCGAIGYLAADGSMEFNVAIRTMIFEQGQVHIPVGGGIVADSGPAAEYEETLVKARAMFAALGVSSDDLRLGH
jgi:para-aminobenzoate synthetase component 1